MKGKTAKEYHKVIEEVLEYIHDNLNNNMELEELSGAVNLSSFHFHRIFRAMVGIPVMQYIRVKRLEAAAEELKKSTRNIIDIAFDTLYESHESFSRSFKKFSGQTPSEFRINKPEIREYRYRGYYKGENIMEVEIRKTDEIRVACVRHTGPYEECGAAWEKLCGYLGPKGKLKPDTEYLGISYDDPDSTPADELRYDACATIDAAFEGEGEIKTKIIPAGEYAVYTHKGPYSGLKNAYDKLFGQWLPQSGRELGDNPCYELYINSPDKVKPEDLITEIFLQLK